MKTHPFTRRVVSGFFLTTIFLSGRAQSAPTGQASNPVTGVVLDGAKVAAPGTGQYDTTATKAAPLPVLPSATPEGVRDIECQSTMGAFVNRSFRAQKGKFVVNLDARITTLGHEDSAVGLAKGGGEGYGSMGCILYFGRDGHFSVRKSRVIASDLKMAYSPNVLYHVRFEVDVPANQYSVFVQPPGAKEEAVAVNYPFRQSDKGGPEVSWPMLDNVRIFAHPGGKKLEICDFKIAVIK